MNPEAVHFPGSLTTKIMASIGLFVCLLLAILAISSPEKHWMWLIDAILISAVAIFLIYAWPSEIITDQHGIHARRFFGLFSSYIEWSEVRGVTLIQEFGGLGARVGASSESLLITDRTGILKITHTPRHPDRQRLLLELKQHGVDIGALPKA